ncbi:MAG: hypothetical protein ACYDD6_05155 [Acidimicrobiales bacterium]
MIYAGDNPVNNVDPSGLVTCSGWLGWVPGCGTITKVQNAVSGTVKAAVPNNWRAFFEGVGFAIDAYGTAGIGVLVFGASIGGNS